MPVTLGIEGAHAHLAAPEEIAAGVRAASEVFARHDADAAEAAAAIAKLRSDELLSRAEAQLCVIWDEAEEAALRAATVGWLSRQVDLRLAVTGTA